MKSVVWERIESVRLTERWRKMCYCAARRLGEDVEDVEQEAIAYLASELLNNPAFLDNTDAWLRKRAWWHLFPWRWWESLQIEQMPDMKWAAAPEPEPGGRRPCIADVENAVETLPLDLGAILGAILENPAQCLRGWCRNSERRKRPRLSCAGIARATGRSEWWVARRLSALGPAIRSVSL